jgi:hypothetical protein
MDGGHALEPNEHVNAIDEPGPGTPRSRDFCKAGGRSARAGLRKPVDECDSEARIDEWRAAASVRGVKITVPALETKVGWALRASADASLLRRSRLLLRAEAARGSPADGA